MMAFTRCSSIREAASAATANLALHSSERSSLASSVLLPQLNLCRLQPPHKMSRKRRNTSSPESDDIPPSKRLQSIPSTDDEELDFDDPQDTKEQPRLNEEFGLHNAFPGLDVDDEELFYGPAADGIDYLRMVR